ncbi:hypothetical protein [Alicyclobacillus sp. SO9]|uniref:DUF7010 family protein n=1 Tax=Alicyclobacillus sp. SO9 TaxID=2665646 RepID=UPI0018E81D80|nr:hypothetical protein [Alicyclobacillus sp. SO9]QQE80584.1 hypothetical protein GI364_09340 [Alicyclobacillus sp. SO9]
MDLLQMKRELSIKGKNGISFLMSGTVVWAIITVIFILPFSPREKDLIAFYSTGLMFPMAVLFSRLIKADWKAQDNPLGSLGLYLNLAQMMYFPVLFWTIVKHPTDMVLLFAIITAAHFYPYGWLYNTKAYYFLGPIVALLLFGIGLVSNKPSWVIPFSMVVALVLMNVFLVADYKKKFSLYLLDGKA